jgi:hypothetical protein
VAEARPQRSDPVPTFNALDYIANLLYQAECAQNNSHGVR